MTKELDLESLDYFVHQTVVKNRGKSKLVAPEMGIGQASFLNKSNPNTHDSHFWPTELLILMDQLQDYRILEEMAYQSGFNLVKSECKEVPLIDALLDVLKEQGEIGSAISSSTADGVIDLAEERHVVAQIHKAKQSLNDLECSVKAFAKTSRGEV